MVDGFAASLGNLLVPFSPTPSTKPGQLQYTRLTCTAHTINPDFALISRLGERSADAGAVCATKGVFEVGLVLPIDSFLSAEGIQSSSTRSAVVALPSWTPPSQAEQPLDRSPKVALGPG